MQEVTRFHALDSLRGLCAIAVVLYHTHLVGSITEWTFFSNADLFVEFFFVLSGFVMAHAYGSKPHLDVSHFLVSRTFRLLPLHVFMLAVFIGLEFLKYAAYKKGFSFNQPPFTGIYAPSEILPNLLLLQSWTHLTENLSFNTASWSISIEYWTYMVFAATLFMASTRRYLLWTVIALGGFALLYSQIDVLTVYAQKGLGCFFAGALAYGFFNRLRRWIAPGFALLSVLEALAAICIWWVLTSELPQKVLAASAVFCVTIVLFAFDGGALSRVLKHECFARLGRWSYSIYLTHLAVLFFVISAFMVVQKKTGFAAAPMLDDIRYLDTGHGWLNNLMVLLILAVVVTISSATYHYVELRGQAAVAAQDGDARRLTVNIFKPIKRIARTNSAIAGSGRRLSLSEQPKQRERPRCTYPDPLSQPA
ncbi:acyltransferase [Pseudomonas sp. CFBP 13711]|uniref:acyltransferase family protein n=1 Tax=unclassified Pseudomonas TaxID=196821 RepID=UPI0017855CC5|nr:MULTISPECIES: acyltransferase [unclassified Pseudomonas]MBD8706876.1 acyltransferase [Pseudomonas sp. CFBP 13711]MBD8712970.1 acyltransferase [Pseudomonas sp. CFBP 13715]